MRNHFRDVVILAFLIPEVFAGFFNRSPAMKRSSSNETIPAPVVIPPSEYWDGDNGEWSSFALRVGTPSQNVRVLVSTNSPETMVVLPAGCTTQAANPVPDGCASSRGGLFTINGSSTWLDQGLYGINGDGVGLEANLGYLQYADYGLETVGLGYTAGANGPTLQNQTVAGIGSVSPIYMGVLGLSTQPVNYSTIGNFSAPSLFTSLRSQNLIPSLSWSFTAGAKYRLKAGQYAQLIFGGYDKSRFQTNAATFSLAGDINRDIVVAVQSIVYSGTTQTTLLSSPIFAFIESTDANIWLPASACQAFEQAFGLVADNSTGLYLMNTTHYNSLLTANPEVTFTLANSLSGGQTVSVALPFSAFALPAVYPFTANSTYYFPLKVAANETQYTLGRTFLQEAYLTVDYERGNFSVSQCLWNDGAASQISSIISPTYKSATNTTTSTPGSSSASNSKAVSPGVIAGVVVGAVVVIAALALAFFYYRRSKRPASPTGENIALAGVAKEDEDKKPSSLYNNSPFSIHKQLHETAPASIYSQYQADGELGGGEIHQMPDHAHNQSDADYATLARRMESERRQYGASEAAGTPVMFEMMGDLPTPMELDDERSREGLLVSPSSSTPQAETPRNSPINSKRTDGPVSDGLNR